MKDQDLEKYLLEKFQGASLRTPKRGRPRPGTIGAESSKSDRKYAKIIRFRFREKQSLRDIAQYLREYYDSIKWNHELVILSGDTICGSVWPAEAHTYLAPCGFYEKDEQGKETNIFSYQLNATGIN